MVTSSACWSQARLQANMALTETAPLLASYWPVIAALLLGYLINVILQAFQGGVGDSNKTTPKARGQPQDEDNHVFQDTIGKEKDALPQGQDNGYAFPGEEEGNLGHVPYRPKRYSNQEMLLRSQEFYQELNGRRSVRFFSDEPVPRGVLENAIRAAGTSPSGAHTEPWTFVVVANLELKQEIRAIVEAEERINYERRMGENWVDDLKPIGTTWKKEYLETAPYLVVLFKKSYSMLPSGRRQTNYYSEISISISVGLFLAALQHVGLVSLTSTPMNAGPQLRRLLDRPSNEKVILLLPVGFPAKDATVPDFKRKPLEDIMVMMD